MSESKRDWWSIEFRDHVSIDAPEFRTDVKALEYVAKCRQLNDPSFVPVALLHVVEITSRKVERLPLEPDELEDIEKITARVKARLLEMKGNPPDGEDGLSWAVRETLKARREQ